VDLFKLLGTITINNSEANKALDDTGDKGKEAESKLGNAFGSIGKGAIAVGKTIVAGLAAGGAAVGALVTTAIQSYAEYEQLVGGVDTLFKESSAKVQEYAANAYKTAGMSANEYMDTVTGFSASLLAGLDGDTAKAAEIANRAITDMSDNANKMGTDITLIQNAYQGFAKQNYDMLDNLKLGYGGTQAEMARLINDSGVLGDTVKVTAETVKDVPFDKVIEAIGVIQDEMGITGTTAKEAATTISGSIASMKSSWQNLLTAIASDELPFDTYVNAFVDSVSTVTNNLLPRIQIALNGVVKLIDKIAPILIAKIPELLSSLLPAIITAATSLINSLVAILPSLIDLLVNTAIPQLLQGVMDIFKALVNALPGIVQSIADALPSLVDMLIRGMLSHIDTVLMVLPNLIQAFTDLFVALMNDLPNIIMMLSERLTELLVELLWGVLPAVLEAIPQLLTALSNALVQSIPIIMDGIWVMIDTLMAAIPELIPQLVNALLTILQLLSEQLPVLIPQLVNGLIAIITLLTEQLPVIIPMLIDAIITIVTAIIEQLPTILMALITALPAILQAVWDAIVMIFMNLPQWFGQLFSGAVQIITTVFSPITDFFVGIWEGIKNLFAPVIDFFANLFNSAWNSIKSIWSGVTSFFSGIWSGITNIFSNVVGFFQNAFSSAWNAIKNVFSGVGQFFTGMWDTIKNAFSELGTKIGDAISGAVRNGINGMLGLIEGVVNGFLGMINGAISLINLIPGVNISKIQLVHFTRLAEGGVVDEPTPAVFGEDGAEAVVPLENNTGWLKKVAKQLHEFSMETKNDLGAALSTRSVDLQQQQLSEMQRMNEKIDRIIVLLIKFFPELLATLDIKMYLDGDILVAETGERMDAELGKIAIRKGRGR